MVGEGRAVREAERAEKRRDGAIREEPADDMVDAIMKRVEHRRSVDDDHEPEVAARGGTVRGRSTEEDRRPWGGEGGSVARQKWEQTERHGKAVQRALSAARGAGTFRHVWGSLPHGIAAAGGVPGVSVDMRSGSAEVGANRDRKPLWL